MNVIFGFFTLRKYVIATYFMSILHAVGDMLLPHTCDVLYRRTACSWRYLYLLPHTCDVLYRRTFAVTCIGFYNMVWATISWLPTCRLQGYGKVFKTEISFVLSPKCQENIGAEKDIYVFLPCHWRATSLAKLIKAYEYALRIVTDEVQIMETNWLMTSDGNKGGGVKGTMTPNFSDCPPTFESWGTKWPPTIVWKGRHLRVSQT